jgi:hypothetical protein
VRGTDLCTCSGFTRAAELFVVAVDGVRAGLPSCLIDAQDEPAARGQGSARVPRATRVRFHQVRSPL